MMILQLRQRYVPISKRVGRSLCSSSYTRPVNIRDEKPLTHDTPVPRDPDFSDIVVYPPFEKRTLIE